MACKSRRVNASAVWHTPPCTEGEAGTMNVFCVLFALVTVGVAGEVLGDEECPDRPWKPADGNQHRCVYWCSVANGWSMGRIENGTPCYYNQDKNGTCYKGLCYGELPENVTLPKRTTSAVVTSPEYSAETARTTQTAETTESSPTTQDGDKKKQKKTSKKDKKKKKKKKKESQEEKGKEDEDEKKKKQKEKKKEDGKKKKKKKEEPTPQEW
uniref:Basic tail secreted protein n=1 Tax=Rhipicephalus appendiculatus TaxID=34631 RepID=A0A131Z409_RHIAP